MKIINSRFEDVTLKADEIYRSFTAYTDRRSFFFITNSQVTYENITIPINNDSFSLLVTSGFRNTDYKEYLKIKIEK